MPSTYCQNCGSKHDYKFEKPNFCTNCGSSMNEARSESLKLKSKRAPESQTKSNLDEEGTEIYEVPDISNLEYEIDIPQSSFSLGSLFSNVQTEHHEAPAKKPRGRPRKKNGKRT